MGYETTLYVVQPTHLTDEWARDAAGKLIKDDSDRIVYTGRKEHFLLKVASIELYKIYDTHLLALRQKYVDAFKAADKLASPRTVPMWYHSDGDTPCKSDKYDDPLVPIPLAEALAAVVRDVADAGDDAWPPLRWAAVLLKEMNAEKNNLHVVCYGH